MTGRSVEEKPAAPRPISRIHSTIVMWKLNEFTVKHGHVSSRQAIRPQSTVSRQLHNKKKLSVTSNDWTATSFSLQVTRKICWSGKWKPLIAQALPTSRSRRRRRWLERRLYPPSNFLGKVNSIQ